MLKNIDWKTLLFSKTFLGALVAACTALVHAWGQWVAGAKATAINEALLALGGLLTAIGIKDATSGPIN